MAGPDAGRDHRALARSGVPGAGCQRPLRRGKLSKVHKLACELGCTGLQSFWIPYLSSGHGGLKLGFHQELGPTPPVERCKACNQLMYGQLAHAGAAMQQLAQARVDVPRGLLHQG